MALMGELLVSDMKTRVVALVWSGMGALIPTIWIVLYRTNPERYGRAALDFNWFDSTLLTIWPSAILMLMDPNDKSVSIPLISVLLNSLMYAAIGALIHMGFRRHRITTSMAVLAFLAFLIFLSFTTA